MSAPVSHNPVTLEEARRILAGPPTSLEPWDERTRAAKAARPELTPYAESTRYAVTWDDIAYREEIGQPYAVPAPSAAAIRATIERGDWRDGAR